MSNQPIEIGLSTVKRIAEPKERVESHLREGGWEETAITLGERVSFYENSGINLTVLEGPFGTVILPSGPVRGLLFGQNATVFSRESALGIEEVEPEEVEEEDPEDATSSEGETSRIIQTRVVETFE